ncbi:VWA domain-containing protein [Streptomyces sp. bgisy084]|uniref:VWA domain-containing protein n=1 Tax=Streptomyces sp. bgisy084 TaxID=3413777 RepID=UPI003D74B88E
MGIRSLLRNAFGRSKATREETGAAPSGADKPESATIPEAREESTPAPATPEAEVPAARTAPTEAPATDPAPTTPTLPAQGSRADRAERAERAERAAESSPGREEPAAGDDATVAVAPSVSAEGEAGADAVADLVSQAFDKPGTAAAETEPAAEAAETKAEPEPEPEAEVEAEVEVEAKAEVEAEPEAEVEAKAGGKAKAEVVAEPEVTADAQAEAAADAVEPEPEVAAEPEPQATTPEPVQQPEADAKPEPEADAKPAAEAKPEDEAKAAAEPQAADLPKDEPKAAAPNTEAPQKADPEADHPTADQPEPEAEARTVSAAAASLPTTAPALVSLYKAAGSTLEKHGLATQRAAVYLVLDRSGSMRPYYKDGTVQNLAEQALGLSAHLDDDATVPVIFFSTDIDGTADLDLTNYEGRIEELHAGLGHMGRTNYHWAINAVVDHYKKSGATAPAFVIFQTDGAPTSKPAAEKALCEAAGLPIFWQFIGFGDPDAKGFDFLRKLDDLAVPEKRAVDNAGFFHAGRDPRSLSHDELYQQLMVEFPEWLTEARAAGVLKDS